MPIGATVVFSSIAGRFGNAGQTDYSAANDLLCKYTLELPLAPAGDPGARPRLDGLGRHRHGHAGLDPEDDGMAGIDMLPAEAGIAYVRRELTESGTQGEVLVAGGWGARGGVPSDGRLGPGVASTRARSGPHGRNVVAAWASTAGSSLSVDTRPQRTERSSTTTASTACPVLPGVMGVEAFAEIASAGAPDLRCSAVEDVDFPPRSSSTGTSRGSSRSTRHFHPRRRDICSPTAG